ncbi:carboxylesterase/lipase family protein [Streptomyces sp. RKAG293]|uniref:carboxylesterase/lipase family protein n=1 Tax=Streptomyces sp. RKAG293 TaxID=2893403 RepID=UPI002033A3D6|nr:carboxylesterase family protein [Streptomyces sp. RKAG293]MCM2423071.1 carboxylesterase family protein [Streptomyces sp. RKAG293]
MVGAGDQDSPVVELPAGTLRGRTEGGVAVFKGVPYAEPPVGDLRWRPARPHPGWSGTRDATAHGPSAPQMFLEGGDPVLGGHGFPPFDEDCLTLNVWTPSADTAGRPVLVWIHGGGFVSGSGSMPHYSGETFARNGDLVVVTINYRIGPLGYLAFGADADAEPANFWLTDQVAALRWVHENIAGFGGDPGNITVAGQSGGAVSTAALAGHPEARTLFRRAILQSPPFGLHIPTRAESAERTAVYQEILGAKEIDELRAVPWPRLIEAGGELFGRTMRWGYWPTPFLPVIDEATLARHPVETLLEGAGSDIDVLIGWTREEANFGFGLDERYAAATRDQVVERAADTFGDRAAEAYAAYESVRPGARPVDVLMDLISDELFRVPSVELAERRAAQGRPVWVYQFDFPTPAHDGRLGAAHCLELPFTFNNFDQWSHAPFLEGIRPGVRDGLASAMHQAWISFIRTGDPNHPALPAWERYDGQSRTTMRFDSVTKATEDLAGDSRRLHSSARD